LIGPDDLDRAGPARRVLEPLARVPLGPGARPALRVRNPPCPPSPYLVAAARPARDLDAAIAAAADRSRPPRAGARPRPHRARPPRDVAILGPEGAQLADAAAASEAGAGPGEVVVERFSPEAIDLVVRARAPAWLVVREAWSPDWTAAVDGRPVDQARADVLY